MGAFERDARRQRMTLEEAAAKLGTTPEALAAVEGITLDEYRKLTPRTGGAFCLWLASWISWRGWLRRVS